MPIKVMLVDDEILVRLGIKSLIDWESHGYEYVGDAPDGRQALALMERDPADIVLTDIVMPHMDGLELIEAVKKRYPHTRIIVLSSHNEYEYVRKAMKLGVDDYLLKASMKPDELLGMLRETADKAEESRKELNRQLQAGSDRERRPKAAEKLRELLDGQAEGEAKSGQAAASDFGFDREPEHYFVMLMRIHRRETDKQSAVRTILNLAELELGKWADGRVFPYADDELVIVAGFDHVREDLAEYSKSIGRDLVSAARRFADISASIGISGPFSDWRRFRDAYMQAKSSLQRCFYDGKGSVYVYDDEAAALTELVPVTFSEEELKRAISLQDENGMIRAVEAVFDRMQCTRGSIEQCIQSCLDLMHFIRKEIQRTANDSTLEIDANEPLYVQILGFEELGEARRWFIHWIGRLAEKGRKSALQTYPEEIQKLIRYVKTNYAEPISLKKAAEMVSMNETYLSYLFKKETKTGFTEFLNQIRVDKAAEYLRGTNMPGYLIAEKVGYENINYFGRVFKKLKGVSPQQYRSQYQR
ncbi:response regulator [Paenibacillus mesophilus]|uniref:response regulator n=1 Tax=Paenibacillus mesophilus TaxID=2582849 RepID=UPI00110D36D2|nr:response regulator [Paenibacillus mesophilus]TMV51519.1 response regulator [Paenibacillus mesophilus]